MHQKFQSLRCMIFSLAALATLLFATSGISEEPQSQPQSQPRPVSKCPECKDKAKAYLKALDAKDENVGVLRAKALDCLRAKWNLSLISSEIHYCLNCLGQVKQYSDALGKLEDDYLMWVAEETGYTEDQIRKRIDDLAKARKALDAHPVFGKNRQREPGEEG